MRFLPTMILVSFALLALDSLSDRAKAACVRGAAGCGVGYHGVGVGARGVGVTHHGVGVGARGT